MAYITHAELRAALSPTSFVAIFDDDSDGIVDADTVDAFIARASAQVDAWIAAVYSGPFPITQLPVPSMIRELTIQYALAYAYERRPDYTRTLEGSAGNDEDRWKRADQMGERLQKAILRIPELPAPANVGTTLSESGEKVARGETTRFFDKMGDFH